MKLATRSLHLLILIDELTERGPDGSLTRFWVPSADIQYINASVYDASGHLPSDATEMWVHGSDAQRLMKLERDGLISRPETTLPNNYVYAITENGRCVVEDYRNQKAS